MILQSNFYSISCYTLDVLYCSWGFSFNASRGIRCRTHQRHVRSKHTTALNWINHEVARCHVQYHDASINDIQSVDYWSTNCKSVTLSIVYSWWRIYTPIMNVIHQRWHQSRWKNSDYFTNEILYDRSFGLVTSRLQLYAFICWIVAML